ncbi:hypothetical protein C8Q80DRAFT_1117060 [Daedaleopsis nitida]|nr:hypothetical protein C8Q80DRAFT_1117060 [Daedaleopsis nitida]
MRTFTLLLSLVVTLATFAPARGLTPADPPKLEVLFLGSFALGDVQTVSNGTFGNRIHVTITGGNLTDSSGNLVGTILPTADVGIVSNNGFIYPDAVLPVVLTADNKYAYFHARGVGIPGVSSLTYVHFETDSEQYIGLNGRFLIGNSTFPDGLSGNALLTIFGA